MYAELTHDLGDGLILRLGGRSTPFRLAQPEMLSAPPGKIGVNIELSPLRRSRALRSQCGHCYRTHRQILLDRPRIGSHSRKIVAEAFHLASVPSH
jgi:hypothetical protein